MVQAVCLSQLLAISRYFYHWSSRWSISHYTQIDFFESLSVVFPGVLFDCLLTCILTQAAALPGIINQFQHGLGELIDIPRLNQHASVPILDHFCRLIKCRGYDRLPSCHVLK